MGFINCLFGFHSKHLKKGSSQTAETKLKEKRTRKSTVSPCQPFSKCVIYRFNKESAVTCDCANSKDSLNVA